MIMDVLDLSPWYMLYADEIVLGSTRREEVENKLEWRMAMKDRLLKISRKKTVYLRFNGDGNIDGNYQSTGREFGKSEYI